MEKTRILLNLEQHKSIIKNSDLNSFKQNLLSFKLFIEDTPELISLYNEKINIYNQLLDNQEFQQLACNLCNQIVEELNQVNQLNNNELQKLGINEEAIMCYLDKIVPVIGSTDVNKTVATLFMPFVDNYIDSLPQKQQNYLQNDYELPLLSRNIWIYEQYYEYKINKNNEVDEEHKHSKLQGYLNKLYPYLQSSYSYYFFDKVYWRNGYNIQLKIACMNIINDFIYYISRTENPNQNKSSNLTINNHINSLQPTDIEFLKLAIQKKVYNDSTITTQDQLIEKIYFSTIDIENEKRKMRRICKYYSYLIPSERQAEKTLGKFLYIVEKLQPQFT